MGIQGGNEAPVTEKAIQWVMLSYVVQKDE